MHTRETLTRIVLLRHCGTIEECGVWVASGDVERSGFPRKFFEGRI